MSSFTDYSLILKRRNLGEADRILTLLTKYHGKLSAVAKGIRRPTSKKGGNLDLLNLAEVKIAEGKNLAIITEAAVIKSFDKIKNSLAKTTQAYYICELINNLIPEGKNARQVFNLTLTTLNSLNSLIPPAISSLNSLMKDFEIQLLKLSGFWSDSMFKDKKPQTLQEWRRFNKIFIEQILNKKLKSPEILL
ncbi:DNA repair protein RecO [candidate division CPR3 bacterium 4484_211]|uniref:DNA repair protein RecO n=1 Tax=candidate division CPR3 bacterium 4484_211 TaxID=1968527 RepID=A0A1W9NXM1_UNCC3|nr:MAG: DNA repair protein RecO [candidate division CPR3 bacterium 4484_211]